MHGWFSDSDDIPLIFTTDYSIITQLQTPFHTHPCINRIWQTTMCETPGKVDPDYYNTMLLIRLPACTNIKFREAHN